MFRCELCQRRRRSLRCCGIQGCVFPLAVHDRRWSSVMRFSIYRNDYVHLNDRRTEAWISPPHVKEYLYSVSHCREFRTKAQQRGTRCMSMKKRKKKGYLLPLAAFAAAFFFCFSSSAFNLDAFSVAGSQYKYLLSDLCT